MGDINPKKVTISDVANYAGMSIATVSRVINRQGAVREETRLKVYDAIQALGYKSNVQFEDSESQQLIIIVLPDIDNPFYSRIVAGIHSCAKSHNAKYFIYICPNVDASFKNLLDFINFTKASGIILLSPTTNKQVLDAIDAAAPLVQCTEYNEQSDLPYVSIDDYAASKSGIEFMLSKGKKQIAIFCGPADYKYARQRLQGYLDTLKANGIEPNPSLIFHLNEVLFEPALSVATQVLSSPNKPDAVFCVSDIFAAAVVKAATLLNISIPSELGVLGFDNTYISTIGTPTVSSISQPQYDLGYYACEILMERIANPCIPHRHIFLRTELIIRESL